MSAAPSTVLLDAGAIENLFTAGKEAAWDLLTAEGRKVLVPREVLGELADIRATIPGSTVPNPNYQLATKFSAWMDTHPTVRVVEGLGFPKGDGALEALMRRDTQLARDALQRAGVSDNAVLRLLTDDSPLELR